MQTINSDFVHTVLQQVQQVAMQLKHTYQHLQPVIAPAQMLAQFELIDGNAARVLQEKLALAYPEVRWLGGELEKQTETDNLEGYYWIVDAIDGAVQYLRSMPYWALSLTLVRDEQAVFTVVADVMHDEVFHAVRGQGAYLNGLQVEVNQREDHYHGILAHSQPPFVARQPRAIPASARSLEILLPDVLAVRNLGPTSLQLAYVACGRLDGFWEFGEDGFNCLGGSLLVQEAGGISSDLGGTAYTRQAGSLVAAAPGVHQSLLQKLSVLQDFC